MNSVARENGALVFPDDPEGGSDKDAKWLSIKTAKKWLAACRANAPVFPPGSGLLGQVTSNGLEIRLAESDRPFAVSLSLGSNGTGYFASVSSRGSTLQALGFSPASTIVISGLDEWKPVQNGNFCYLRGTVATNAWEIRFGSAWAPGLPPFTLDLSSNVEFVYRLIARFEVDSMGGGLRVRQILRDPLRLESRLESGVYLDYPVTA